MNVNTQLNEARKNYKNEFYTQYKDIEKELVNYQKDLRDKIVYCNCDDPNKSNFFKYFVNNFNRLKLKKLIATNYVYSLMDRGQLTLNSDHGLSDKNKPFKTEINKVLDNTNIQHLLKDKNNKQTKLKLDGDFRNEENIEILKQADVIITNPPFSLFGAYIKQLIKYNKKFIIIGNQNAIKFRTFFNCIKNNNLWIGKSVRDGIMNFIIPNEYKSNIIINNIKYVRMPCVCWYSNFGDPYYPDFLQLKKKYTKGEYQKYDNYDAININNVNDIPMDYYQEMGVPITFFYKYNPLQFRIIDKINPIIKNKSIYERFIIQRR